MAFEDYSPLLSIIVMVVIGCCCCCACIGFIWSKCCDDGLPSIDEEIYHYKSKKDAYKFDKKLADTEQEKNKYRDKIQKADEKLTELRDIKINAS